MYGVGQKCLWSPLLVFNEIFAPITCYKNYRSSKNDSPESSATKKSVVRALLLLNERFSPIICRFKPRDQFCDSLEYIRSQDDVLTHRFTPFYLVALVAGVIHALPVLRIAHYSREWL